MNTTTAPEIERLRSARPGSVEYTAAISPPLHRDALLASILASREEPQSVRAWPRLAAGVAATAAVVAVAVGTVEVVLDSPSASTGRVAPPPLAETITLDRIKLAMSAAEAGVVRIDADPGNGVIWEMWSDEAGSRSRSTSKHPDGRLIYEHEITVRDGTASVVVVSHADRAWWRYDAPAGRGDARFHPTPDDIRAQLDEGTLVEVGRSDGEIQLRTRPSDKPGAPRTVASDLWVDAETFLPKRTVSEQAGRVRSTATYTWLPRTDETVAETAVEIPAGYRQLPGAPERRGSGAGIG